MNALTPSRPGAGALALLPQNQRDAMELASMMAKAGFFPKELQSPGACLFVVEQAMRWNMSPYAVATEMSFPQGKPMFSGKLVAAAVQSSGAIVGRLHYTYSGEGDARMVTVRGTLRGEQEPVTVDVRLRDARTNNQHWTKSPDQMLAYHGARVWARRYCPEVMLGVYAPEEFDEKPSAEAAEPLPPARGPVVEIRADASEPDLVMLTPDMGTRSAPGVATWEKWCLAAIQRLATASDAAAWERAMEPHFAAAPADAVERVRQAVAARTNALDEEAGA